MAKFIRVVKPEKRMELLVNVDHISKIEVFYVGDGGYMTPLESAGIPGIERRYKVYVAGETMVFEPNPDDPVVKVIEEIYKSAIKA